MKLSYVLIAVVLVVAGIYFVAQRSGAMEITQEGDELSISIGYYRLQARKASDEYSDSMLVVGGMEPSRHLFFTALLAVIPLDQAEALAKRYGDFRKCSSPGAAAGKRSVESMVLFAANPAVERTLEKINKLALAGKDPVISMKFTCLEITDYKIEKEGYSFDFDSLNFAESYLVTEVELLRQGMER
jgi:hypothetical protein